jgi:hypothetical protein
MHEQSVVQYLQPAAGNSCHARKKASTADLHRRLSSSVGYMKHSLVCALLTISGSFAPMLCS